MRTVRLALKVAMIAIRFVNIRTGFTDIIKELILLVQSLEIFIADIAVRIKTGFAFRGKGIATPVQVRHAGIPVQMSPEAKKIASMISSDNAAEDILPTGVQIYPKTPLYISADPDLQKYLSRVRYL